MLGSVVSSVLMKPESSELHSMSALFFEISYTSLLDLQLYKEVSTLQTFFISETNDCE